MEDKVLYECKRELAYIGFPLSKASTMKSYLVQLSLLLSQWTPLKMVSYEQSYFVALSMNESDTRWFDALEKVREGGFGELWQGLRDKVPCFLKYPKYPSFSRQFRYEGILQCLARACLRAYGFVYAVPKVLDILTHPTKGCALVFEMNPNARLLSEYMHTHIQWKQKTEANNRLLFSILAQVATYGAILEQSLFFNHRDITGNNVLMIEPCEPEIHTVTLKGRSWTLRVHHRTILIDFGFSCVGSSTNSILFEANHFPGDIRFCQKSGRDTCLFLASLWNSAPLRESLTDAATALFRKWLTIGSKNWATWLETVKPVDLRQMYFCLADDSFSHASTSPFSMLQDIATLYPEIVSFKS